MKVFTVICVHARETNTMQEWICSVWNVHIQIMLKVISFSILNMHELVETTGCHSQMHTFPDQMNWHFVQILMDSKFQSKFHALDTDDVAQKTSLFSVQGQSAWCCFMVLVPLFYVIWVRYTKYSVNAYTPITTILATHLLHEFIVNVKYTMDWSNRKPYTFLSFNFIVK